MKNEFEMNELVPLLVDKETLEIHSLNYCNKSSLKSKTVSAVF